MPPFDWTDPTTWEAPLDGVAAAYVTYYPDLAVSGAADTVAAFAALAADRGVERLLLLTGRGEEEAERAEREVRTNLTARGAAWTIIRSSFFSQNFSESFFLDPLLEGELALSVNGVPEPFVDADDIADVAVAALTDDRHAGRLYELAGPRLLRFEEAVEEIAAASGRALRFTPISAADYSEALRAQSIPEEVIGLMRYLLVLDGRNARLADGVQRALGREPGDFRDYARRAAGTGVWSTRSRAAA